jgi:replicative DNA helicase
MSTATLGLSDETAPPEDGSAPPPPAHDLLAEQSVVGSMLLDREAVDDVMEVMLPSDFYYPKHEEIAKAIARLTVASKPTDVVAVKDELARTGKLREAGDEAYLWTLTSQVVTPANAGYYAEIVKKLAIRRRLVVAGTRIVQMGNATEGEIDALVENARRELDEVVIAKRSKVRMIGDGIFDLIGRLDEKPTYLPTPWQALDKLIGGAGPGELIIVAARPGSGKSIALLQWAAGLAHHGVVALSSLEMSEEALQLRLLSQYGPVSMTALRKHALTGDDKKKLAEAWQAVREAPIFVDPTPGVTLAQIRGHVRMVARHGNLAGIFVDYLQLVNGEGQSRQEVVAQVAEGLKALAKDLNVPVIAAAQLKRAGVGRGRQLPTLDDLRESGAIEQAADVVLLFDRDKDKSPHDLTVIVAKNRNGEQGKFQLTWQAEFARLRDKRWSPTALIEESELS